ncbi:MAG: tetratricopeptide repeat protein, partial [bacterium]|nr:tetratricopeptide repeat protein [bacterium]
PPLNGQEAIVMGSSTDQSQNRTFIDTYNRAVELGEAGDFPSAIALTRDLCTRYPTDATAWSHLSGLLNQQKDHRGALAAAQDAIARDPGHSPAYINAGIAARGLRDLEAARQHLKEATRIAPSDPDAQLELGITLVRLRQAHAAVDAFIRSIAEAHRKEVRSVWLIERSIEGLAGIKPQPSLDEPLRSLHDGIRRLVTGDFAHAYQRIEHARDAALDDETVRGAAEALLGYVWRQHALTNPTDPNDGRDQSRTNVLYL